MNYFQSNKIEECFIHLTFTLEVSENYTDTSFCSGTTAGIILIKIQLVLFCQPTRNIISTSMSMKFLAKQRTFISLLFTESIQKHRDSRQGSRLPTRFVTEIGRETLLGFNFSASPRLINCRKRPDRARNNHSRYY